jgi:hypothetical protein
LHEVQKALANDEEKDRIKYESKKNSFKQGIFEGKHHKEVVKIQERNEQLKEVN